MSGWHFGRDFDMWLYPPVRWWGPEYDLGFPEPIEAADIQGTLLINANDAIEQVRKLQAENAELRKLTLQLTDCCDDWAQKYVALQSENEKLRDAMWDRAHARAIQHMEEDELRATCTELLDYVDELKALAQRLYYCGQSDRECDRCGMNGADIHVKMSDVDYCDGINMCVRDLGIEVDE